MCSLEVPDHLGRLWSDSLVLIFFFLLIKLMMRIVTNVLKIELL